MNFKNYYGIIFVTKWFGGGIMAIEYFANDRYKVLSAMHDRQISVNDENVVKLSQQEISEIVGISKVKVNGIIAELKNDGYLVSKKKGHYQLTSKATNEISSYRKEQ